MDPKLKKAAEEGDVMYLATKIFRIKRMKDEGPLGMYRKIYETAEEEGRRVHRRLLETTKEGGYNILHLAAKAGHDHFVALGLQSLPALSNQMNSEGETPLDVAAKFGHLNVVETIKNPKLKFKMQRDKAACTTTLIGTYSSGSTSTSHGEEGLADIPLAFGTVNDIDIFFDVDNVVVDQDKSPFGFGFGMISGDNAEEYGRSGFHQADMEERNGIIAVETMDPKLYEAAKKGDVSCLSGIDGRNITEDVAVGIQDGKFLKRTQYGNNNILHIAARAGRDTFVAKALQRFPFLSDQVNSEGDTPLLVAARFGHLEVVKRLAEPNKESQMRDDMAATAVEKGTNSRSSRGQGDIEAGQIDDLEQGPIQDNVATMENEITNSSIHQREEEEGPIDNQREHATSLEIEAEPKGKARILKFLRKTRLGNSLSDSSQRDEGVQCKFEDVPISRVKNFMSDTTALHEALRNGHESVAQHLIALHPEMLTSVNGAGESPLYLAAESNCQTFMTDVLQSKQQYSTEGPEGQNALHAARHCGEKIISQLIEQNRDLKRKMDNRGKAPIHHAVEADYRVLFDQMLKVDATIVLLRDNEGYTPFLRASSRGCWDICKEMLQECPEAIEARLHTRIYRGLHALHLAILAEEKIGAYPPELMELVNVGDDEGDTPLHLAVKQNQYEKAKSLIYSASINLGAVNKGGLTVLDLCESDCQHITGKRLMWHHLRKLGAPRGRHPNQDQLPAGGPKGVTRSRDEDVKPIIDTLALVAALLATLTFTAAFTMPGGYDSSPDNLGVATLAKKAALKVFILSDTLAMCCSILALFLLLHAMRVEQDVAVPLRNTSRSLVLFALYATLVAFMSGVFAVIAHKALWVAILVCVICSAAPYFVLASTVEKFPHLMPTILMKAFRWTKSERMEQYIGHLQDIVPAQIPSKPAQIK